MLRAMRSKVRRAPSSTKRSPTRGGRPCGRNACAKPGCRTSSSTWAARVHFCCTTTGTAEPRVATSMAGAIRSPNGSAPKRSESAVQPPTAPGTVTVSQPRGGVLVASAPWRPRIQALVQRAGAWPDAFRPCRREPSQTSAKRSEPMPLLHGSTIAMTAAVAIAASTALPPRCRIERPACAASGCDVETTLRPNTGWRVLE